MIKKSDTSSKKHQTLAKETEKHCQEIRTLAQEAREQFRWRDLLTHTKSKECWKSPSERIFLRLQARVALKEYAQCVEEGRPYKGTNIASMVSICQNQLSKGN